ncbi:hypothetical protein P885DRAFT_79029 [Corynascus similis CBS 632.67]
MHVWASPLYDDLPSTTNSWQGFFLGQVCGVANEAPQAGGTDDAPFGTQVPAKQIKLFTSSTEARLTLVEGGNHYLNATNPKEVGSALLEMVNKYK